MMIYAIAAVYFLFFGSIVYRYDLFEREPWYALAFVAALCAAMTWGFAYFADIAMVQLSWVGSERFVGALIAGVGEELVKLTSVLITFLIL